MRDCPACDRTFADCVATAEHLMDDHGMGQDDAFALAIAVLLTRGKATVTLDGSRVVDWGVNVPLRW